MGDFRTELSSSIAQLDARLIPLASFEHLLASPAVMSDLVVRALSRLNGGPMSVVHHSDRAVLAYSGTRQQVFAVVWLPSDDPRFSEVAFAAAQNPTSPYPNEYQWNALRNALWFEALMTEAVADFSDPQRITKLVCDGAEAGTFADGYLQNLGLSTSSVNIRLLIAPDHPHPIGDYGIGKSIEIAALICGRSGSWIHTDARAAAIAEGSWQRQHPTEAVLFAWRRSPDGHTSEVLVKGYSMAIVESPFGPPPPGLVPWRNRLANTFGELVRQPVFAQARSEGDWGQARHLLREQTRAVYLDEFRLPAGDVPALLHRTIPRLGYKSRSVSGAATVAQAETDVATSSDPHGRLYLRVAWKPTASRDDQTIIAWSARSDPADLAVEWRKVVEFGTELWRSMSEQRTTQSIVTGSRLIGPGEVPSGPPDGEWRDFSGCATVDEVRDLTTGVLPLGRWALTFRRKSRPERSHSPIPSSTPLSISRIRPRPVGPCRAIRLAWSPRTPRDCPMPRRLRPPPAPSGQRPSTPLRLRSAVRSTYLERARALAGGTAPRKACFQAPGEQLRRCS
jgi:hypothetical protein